jgi:surface carbohydrate biosynthesis protein
MNVDFLITYEHKARELEAVSLIKAELERRGHSVALSCTYDEERVSFAQRFKAKVVITPALYNDLCLYGFVYGVAGLCRKVVNLQWEQALTNQDESDPSFYQNPKGEAKLAVHACWGLEPRNRLLRAGVDPSRAQVVGPIHMDFTRDAFRSVYLSKSDLGRQFGIDESKDWVLFISSFTYVNMSAEEYATEVRHMGVRLNEFQELSVRSREAILKWLETAAVAHPDKIFIYRPHPSENEDSALLQLQSRCGNIRAIADLPIKQWICCSSTILSWYSTAVAEAFHAGKNCTVIRPVEIPHEWDVSIYRNAHFVSDLQGFLEAIDREADEFPLEKELLRTYFDVRAETPTYRRLCDLLERVARSAEYDMPSRTAWFRIGLAIHRARHRLFFVVKELLARTDYRRVFRHNLWLVSRIDNHVAVMDRLQRDRPKNQASAEELAEMMSKLRRIVDVS